ncbi:aspartate--tRNA ligase [Halobacteriovorax sp. GB3]|uniref:aspartate--tRNA ligase n=1 Tax=Halobacteriovorax sp. GB3 TaxID=2719615 RepID=UPI002361CA1A|nr:aspartate--tRNA ligase [Halobacteriovorax sp. GB3]MDD0853838.1 aspartate--tRNA ligase [Halobacteriovorax sp. GB3]
MTKLTGLMRTHHCGELTEANIGQEVTLCGWVNKYRNLGSLHFIDLRDKYGLTQLGFAEFKGDMALLKKCHLESVILAKGKVAPRPDEAKNDKMTTGMVEVQVEELQILSENDINNIPFLPFGAIEATDDNKLKYRYLDLRTEKLQNMLRLRSKTAQKVRNFLSNEDFIEVETPILYKSTPEGARDYVVPSRVHPHHVYALPQSPQTLKQLLMIGGTDRYFQICKCFRDEDLRADRQPEFTQIDIEVSFATQPFMKSLVEGLLKDVYQLDDDFTVPVMSYDDAMRDYGCDKPDVRFGLKQYVVNDIFEGTDFGVFASVLKENGLIKTFFVPKSAGTFSRKDTDSFVEVVKPHGGRGVAFFKVEEGARSAGISKFVTDEIHEKLNALSSETGDGTWLFFADANEEVAHACADALRRHLGSKLDLIEEGYKFLWVNDFPLLEYDDGRFYAKHHPFTMVRDEDVDAFMKADPKDPEGGLKKIYANAYDIVCNGYEIGGGSIRIFNQAVQKKMFEVLGMSEEEVNKQFGFFVEALNYGVPPHGGIAFGFDRMIMLLAGTENIRDVIAFPKTTSASDLMSSAPSVPSADQLEELHFMWSKKS